MRKLGEVKDKRITREKCQSPHQGSFDITSVPKLVVSNRNNEVKEAWPRLDGIANPIRFA